MLVNVSLNWRSGKAAVGGELRTCCWPSRAMDELARRVMLRMAAEATMGREAPRRANEVVRRLGMDMLTVQRGERSKMGWWWSDQSTRELSTLLLFTWDGRGQHTVTGQLNATTAQVQSYRKRERGWMREKKEE